MSKEKLVNKALLTAAIAIAMAGISGPIGPSAAYAKSDKTSKAQLQECKKLADPKMKDECVKRAGKGMEKKANAKASDGKNKGKGKQQ
jgi:hypothetical protein